MSDVSALLPLPLWRFFAQICTIPHPSGHEEELAQFIMNWAKKENIAYERDAAGNLLLKKPASLGMENKKIVTIQAHLDMVPQKNNDIQHDFTKDPIQPYIEDEWVHAKGTTLGADNGIGMAAALAILADNTLIHGELEILLTMSEETGMDGAFGLKPNWLKGEILINTDSEEEGEVYMGCAGGINVSSTLPIEYTNTTAEEVSCLITLKGLRGGHSGVDIHLERGNANKLLSRFLVEIYQEIPFKLVSFNGGTLRNAIPREAFAQISIQKNDEAKLKQLVTKFHELLKKEIGAIEPTLHVSISSAKDADKVMTDESTFEVISLLNAFPNGVLRMSNAIPGVVETSLNVGVVTTNSDNVHMLVLVRSLIESGKNYAVEQIKSLGYLAGATIEVSGSYPGWEPDVQSPIMEIVRKTYHQLFDSTPNIKVIHAGLECGLFKQPYPSLDMVSIGPTIVSPHSPDEKVNIPSVRKFWQLLTAILKHIPDKD